MEVLVARKTFDPEDEHGRERKPVQVGDQVGAEYILSSGCYSYVTETALGIDTLVVKLEACQGHKDPFGADETLRKEVASRFVFTKELASVAPLVDEEQFLLNNLTEEAKRFFRESMDIRAHWDDTHPLKRFRRDRDTDGIVDQMDENGFFHLVPERRGGDTQFSRAIAECGSRVVVQKQRMLVFQDSTFWPFKGDKAKEYYINHFDEQCAQDPHAVYYIDDRYDYATW